MNDSQVTHMQASPTQFTCTQISNERSNKCSSEYWTSILQSILVWCSHLRHTIRFSSMSVFLHSFIIGRRGTGNKNIISVYTIKYIKCKNLKDLFHLDFSVIGWEYRLENITPIFKPNSKISLLLNWTIKSFAKESVNSIKYRKFNRIYCLQSSECAADVVTMP